MGKNAYIKMVNGSTQQELTLDDVKQALDHFIHMTQLTGEQLDWGYAENAFPYTVEEQVQEGTPYLLLKGNDPRLYKYLIIGVRSDPSSSSAVSNCIQLVVPQGATHGDTSKANEFSRYLARRFQAELHLLNGRIMYFNPRKL
ncbi:protein of unknown function [Marininema mesophilum]|uniref:DUF1885 family protein n=1 Tax=Marininema mesophilum TaxID=1048340 RepID=A0A1H2QLT4_9BACL|nr:DUF1885 family protein [Marininema mesophilum]SDW07624.1 protein of unknown function [Marininema mesophilum]